MTPNSPPPDPDRLAPLSPADHDPAGALDALTRNLDPTTDAQRYATQCHEIALAAEQRGHVDDAIALARAGVDRLLRAQATPGVEVGWLEYAVADLYTRRPAGDPDGNRDAAIHYLERAVTRRVEDVPSLYARAWGALGDRYARRRAGDRADNQRKALAAYESALAMAPPVGPVADWAINAHHYGLTLLESGNGDPVDNAAEAVAAHWQAMAAAIGSGDRGLHDRAMDGCHDALDELVVRLRGSGAPSPYEVALPEDSPVPAGKEGAEVVARMQAVVAVRMTESRPVVVDDQVITAGQVWEQVEKTATEAGRASLRGVALLNLARLRRRLRAPLPGDVDHARGELSAVAGLLDPVLHPWAWERYDVELAGAWSEGEDPGPR